MKAEPDAWLAEILGCEAFRITLSGDEVGLYESLVAAFARVEGRRAFYYAKIPTRRVDQARALTAAGFYAVEVNVTLEREPELVIQPTVDESIRVGEIRPEEHEAALDIAAACFVYTRFHLDPQIPNAIANAIKRAWVNSYLLKRRGEQLLIGERDGVPMGFLAVLRVTTDGEPVRVIDLVGVASDAQRCGVGRRMVEFFVTDSVDKCARLRVGTQAANIPSIRLYEHCGFRMTGSAYTLHAHVLGGKVNR